ncbi:cyclin-domain-containing protein [Basidiobolus meristosporus CBS 931.73]|uniref:Cyclin-domain-containing protein n=1 Tax=Basidiobolus meristosporus CBS 931.73 TaxID=1314790 RepID=A0A1Y1Y7D0_9FUNG|nr:cyclin-domain-containing protein [Basidiobolus meristosporus CBS 931.73]|eukprot:ORX93869.1 cyclin-domain-containing protein [Basidiobolus meristosporus CBS 931.73]
MPSFDFVKFPVTDTITLVAEYLGQVARSTEESLYICLDNGANTRRTVNTPFHARKIPSIDVHAYLTRILKYCPSTNDCLIAVVVYLERIRSKCRDKNEQGLVIDPYNIHRLIIVAFVIATKFFSDIFYTNTRYAKVGGLAASELNSLELQFLKLTEFNLNIDSEELQYFADCLLNKKEPALDIPQTSMAAEQLDSPVSSVDDSIYQSWSPPSTPTASEESSPMVYSSVEFKDACYINKSISSADLIAPLKHKFSGANVEMIIRRPDTTHATTINQYSCSGPMHSQTAHQIEFYEQPRNRFRKLSIQSGKTYGSSLSYLLCSNTST